MSGFLATFKREMRAYFVSPLAYVIATFVLLVASILFGVIVLYLSDPQAPAGRPFDVFFGMAWLLVLFVTPFLTMRLLAEERKSGSIEALMTSPVTEMHVVLGKYAAALAFFAFLWVPTLLFAGIVAYHTELDWGTVAAGYLGILGVGAVSLAVGLFASAMTKNQIVAGVVTFAILFVFFWVFGWMEDRAGEGGLKAVWGHLNLLKPMDDLAKGIVDTRALVYFVSIAALFLFLTARALEAKKWR